MSTTETVGVLVGRFQIPQMNDAYRAMISKVSTEHNFTMLCLSTSPIPGNREQPLTYAMRRAMISDSFPNALIFPFLDIADPVKWTKTLDARIKETFPLTTVRIYAAPDFVEMYRSSGGVYPQTILTGPDSTADLADARKRIINNADFRRGVFYGTNHAYKRIISTVDGAIISGDTVLLGRKPNETAWRFMGGFTEVTSTSDEQDLSRECREELNLIVKPEDWHYIGRINIDDWRYAGSGDQIRTGFYVAFEYLGIPKAGDDLADVRWVDLDAKPEDIPLVSEHVVLWNRLQEARHIVYDYYCSLLKSEVVNTVNTDIAPPSADEIADEDDEELPF